MQQHTSLTITSIAGSENPVLTLYAAECFSRGISFIVAGDTKSPEDFSIRHCDFLSIARQRGLSFKLAGLVPDRSYAKKNIAYLHAIQQGATVIVETDDDNFPLESFWQSRVPEMNGFLLEEGDWTNIYRYFSDTGIWPRGFSLKHLEKEVPALGTRSTQSCYCPIQQGLADENPDVDAVYRLSQPLPIYFKSHPSILLGKNSICPFNSQNTTWFPEAFALLYLPSYCSFRMTDIWRSYVAQRILWTCGWKLAFHDATVYQKRNEHDLMKDFEDELYGYLHNDAIIHELMALDLKTGKEFIFENLKNCYALLIKNKHVGPEETPLLNAWIDDLQRLLSRRA